MNQIKPLGWVGSILLFLALAALLRLALYHFPPAYQAATGQPYLAGHLKDAGFDDIHFIDAMTDDLDDEEIARRLADLSPDVVGCTAITPSIYAAERILVESAVTTPGVRSEPVPTAWISSLRL